MACEHEGQDQDDAPISQRKTKIANKLPEGKREE
jgi:hypothetical protein